MSIPTGHSRVCPTRIDGAVALFAHRVTQEQCQDRQRGRYHKCFTCAYNNTYVALHGLPAAAVATEEVNVPTGAVVKAS